MSMLVITETMLPEGPAGAQPAGGPAVLAPWYVPVKTAFEFAAALFLLILTAPLILVAMILIRLTSAGPAFYTQARLGRHGKPFTIYKLRTMTHNCESLTGAQWSKPGDTRVTTVGRWLRKSHIDELPQLWNVLRGDMSLVGPRPEREIFIRKLSERVPFYAERLLVPPGITGWAQVMYPYAASIEESRRKLQFDLYYIKHMSFFLDMYVLLKTFKTILFGRERTGKQVPVKQPKPRYAEVKTETLFFNPVTPPAKAEPKTDEPEHHPRSQRAG